MYHLSRDSYISRYMYHVSRDSHISWYMYHLSRDIHRSIFRHSQIYLVVGILFHQVTSLEWTLT